MGAGDKKIDIAIIGAGITSLCLAHALLKHGHISVHIYEARPQLGEDGTGVGIANNGQKALQLISPELRECLNRAGGVPMIPNVRLMLCTAPDFGKHVADIHNELPNITVIRSRWITKMLELIPEGTVQTGKRLIEINDDEKSGKILLNFDDGALSVVDGVIGCDGINSFVRRFVLEPEQPNLEATYTNNFNTRIVIPMKEARSIFGDEYCDMRTQTVWIGQNSLCLTDIENDGEVMQVIAGCSPDDTVEEVFGRPWVEVPKDLWLSRFQGHGWIGEKVSEVIRRQDKVFAAAGRVLPATPTYVKGRVCVAGDAARAFAPARGAGASQGIEDALMLSSVLARVKQPTDIGKAFDVYDRLRRPRRDKVADGSDDAMHILVGRHPEYGTDEKKLSKMAETWNDFIYNYDLEGAQDEARRLMDA